MVTTPLLIHDVPEAIQYTQVIQNCIILVQYILHNEETFCYIEYVLYKLEKTKIIFEQYELINSKLY